MTGPPVRLQRFTTPAAVDLGATFYAVDDTCSAKQGPLGFTSGHLYVSGNQESPHARFCVNWAAPGSLVNSGLSGYRDPQALLTRSRSGVTPTAVLTDATTAVHGILQASGTSRDFTGNFGQDGSLVGGISYRTTAAAAQFDSFFLTFDYEVGRFASSNILGLVGPTAISQDDADILFMFGVGSQDFNSPQAVFKTSFGIATKDGTQFCLAQGETNGVAAGRPMQVVYNNKILAEPNANAASVRYTFEVSNFTPTTFDLTGVNGTGSPDDDGDFLYWLGVKLQPGVAYKLFSFTTPTVTGQVHYAAPNFKPQMVLFVGSSMEAFNTPLFNDAKAGGFCVGAFQDYGFHEKQYCVGTRVKQGANPTDTASAFSEHALAIPSDSNCYSVVADLVSTDATGFTLDYTAVTAAAKVVFALAIEYSVPPCGAPEPDADMIGGTNLWLGDDEIVVARKSFLDKTGLGSEIELGPFRYAEQKQADETSMVSSLIIGLSEADNGTILFINWNDDDTGDEDWNDAGGTEDIYENWGLGWGDPDTFGLELMATNDGLTPQHQGPETLEPVEELGSARQYSPAGISAIFHRLKLTAYEAGERYYVKFVDIAGALTGRHR